MVDKNPAECGALNQRFASIGGHRNEVRWNSLISPDGVEFSRAPFDRKLPNGQPVRRYGPHTRRRKHALAEIADMGKVVGQKDIQLIERKFFDVKRVVLLRMVAV